MHEPKGLPCRSGARWWGPLYVALLGCVPTSGRGDALEPTVPTTPSRPAPPPPALHYAIEIPEDIRGARVRICFEGVRTAVLAPGNSDALRHVDVVHRDDERPLPRTDAGFVLEDVRDGDCIHYGIDFSAMERLERSSRRIRFEGDSLLVRPNAWLWRPTPLPSHAEVLATFTLPEGVEVSVPWEPVDTDDPRRPTYRLDRTAFTWLAYSVFGRPRIQRFRAAGADIELAVLDAPLAATAAGLRAWATDAARSVALLYGAFPRERLQIVVVPTLPRGGTIHFGAAGRGGGPGVYILMDAGARDEDLPGTWTTVHELLHHGMPFVADAWMAEGWVSYYTEIVRTRMGHRSEKDGWQKLFEAFERGRRGLREMPLRRLSDEMHRTGAYQGVYWSGAAIAFVLDVALRVDSGGRRSLDDAMRELRRCCGDAPRKWKAADLLEHLDDWHGEPVFSTTADALLDRRGFPPVEEAFARLGVRILEGRVVLDDDHPGAAQRRAIMAPAG